MTQSTPPNPSKGDSLEDAVESFVAHLRRGEQPSVADFVERFPDKAEELRDILGLLEAMEGAGKKMLNEAKAASQLAHAEGEDRRLGRVPHRAASRSWRHGYGLRCHSRNAGGVA